MEPEREQVGVGGVPLTAEVEALKKALREAILSTNRTISRCTDYDSAGSTYEISWSPDVLRWAGLCGLDMNQHDPCFYSR